MSNLQEMRILITDSLHESGTELLRAEAQVDDRAGIPAKDLLEAISEYDALIVRGRTQVTARVFEAGTRLKVVGRAGVGVDNIDLASAKAHGVIVVNAPKATTLAVAEHTLGLMLALARMIPRADANMKTGKWLKKDLGGVELNGKVLGVIGVGNIGSAVAHRADFLGMKVLGYDPHRTRDEMYRWGAQPVALADLFAQADFISLHAPLNAETRCMIDAQALGTMKPGVRLICTARGGIIDEAALLEALESGHVAGAALDVFEVEPPGTTALATHPNVIATPHIGAQTSQAQARAAQDIAEEILSALRGEPLHWQMV
jgi:D-3-phosphoglycerate dehydrogenase